MAAAVEERPRMEKDKKDVPEVGAKVDSVPGGKDDSMFGKDTSILSMDLQGLESAQSQDEVGAAGDVKKLDLGGIQLLGKGEFKDKAGEQGNSGAVKTDVKAQIHEGSQTQIPEKKGDEGRDLKTIQEIGSDMEEVSLGSNGGNDKSTCCREEAPKKPDRVKGNEKAGGDQDEIGVAPPAVAGPNPVNKKATVEATEEGQSVPKVPGKDKVPAVSSMSTFGKAIRNSLFMCCTKNTTTDDAVEETTEQGEAQRQGGTTSNKQKKTEVKKNEKKDVPKLGAKVDATFTTVGTFEKMKIEKKDVLEVGAKLEVATTSVPSVGNNEKNENKEAVDSASDEKDDSMFGKDTSSLSLDLKGLASSV